MYFDWQTSAVRLQKECWSYGWVLLVAAVAIAVLANHWAWYVLAGYVGLYGVSALSAKM
jgi:hypothetical protein